jgi:hypothetical protein
VTSVDIATGSVFNLSLREQISADAKRSEPTSSISTYFSRSQADLSIKCLTFRARSALVNKFDGNCHRPISTHLSCSQQTGFPLGVKPRNHLPNTLLPLMPMIVIIDRLCHVHQDLGELFRYFYNKMQLVIFLPIMLMK